MGKHEFKGNLRKFKEGLKGEKKVMEHHQTVARPHNGTPGWWATIWCTYIHTSDTYIALFVDAGW